MNTTKSTMKDPFADLELKFSPNKQASFSSLSIHNQPVNPFATLPSKVSNSIDGSF